MSISVAALQVAAAEPELGQSAEFATFQSQIAALERSGELGDALCVLAAWRALDVTGTAGADLAQVIVALRVATGDRLTAAAAHS